MRLGLKKFVQILKKLGPISLLAYAIWLLVFILTAFYAFRAEYNYESERIEYDTDMTAIRTANEFYSYLDFVEGELERTVSCTEEKLLDGCDAEGIQDFFERRTVQINRSDESDDFIFYGYINGKFYDGVGWAYTDGAKPEDRDWYRLALEEKGKMAYVTPYKDMRTGDIVVTISQALTDNRGVIALDIKVDRLHKMAIERMNDDKHKTIIVIDDDGVVIAHSIKEEIGKNLSEETDTLGRLIYDTWKEMGEFPEPQWIPYENHDYMLGSYRINEEWTALTLIDSDKVMHELFEFLRNSLIFGVVGSILIFATILMMASKKLQADEFYENLLTMSKSYMAMYEIDLEFDSFREISCTNLRLHEAIGRGQRGANEKMLRSMNLFTEESSREEMAKFVDLTTLPERMQEVDSLSSEFLGIENHWMRGRFIVAERSSDGKAKRVLWSVRSIDPEKRERDRLRYLADTDKLTGILNRGSGEARIAEMIKGYEGIFILLDVDKFKSINDTFGHRVGDKVLIAVAGAVKKSFREDDVVMRLGGDEFVAFAKNVGTKADAMIVLQRLLQNVQRIRIQGVEELKVAISVGVTYSKPEDKPRFNDLYKRADAGTYESKTYEGSYVTYDATFETDPD
ncbi:MAG: sensor domain-containing diguanylate cyclase [Lachnospiraceae bacterium]|nr:sensor domain-containing diguanylate cyclase [Lachnospiraceae bacterium]